MSADLSPPLAALLELTHRCPLQCPYCSNPLELERAKGELSTAEWLRVMEATPPAPGFERVLTPGLEEAEAEVERAAKGIPLHHEVIDWFEEICKQLEIPFNLRAVAKA